MKRRFALTFLAVTLVAAATGCGPKKSLRTNKARGAEAANKARSAEAEATAEATPRPVVPAAAPPPSTAVALPVTAAGAGGSPGGGMAVVILMLPPAEAAGATGSAGAARTYKLSLSANSDTAVVQVDGQPAVTAPVQRVYPAASAPRVSAAPAAPAAAIGRPVVPRPVAPVRPRLAVQASPPAPPVEAMPAYNGTMEPVDSRMRPLRRTSITTAMRPPLPPPVIMNPNGAPIID